MSSPLDSNSDDGRKHTAQTVTTAERSVSRGSDTDESLLPLSPKSSEKNKRRSLSHLTFDEKMEKFENEGSTIEERKQVLTFKERISHLLSKTVVEERDFVPLFITFLQVSLLHNSSLGIEFGMKNGIQVGT